MKLHTRPFAVLPRTGIFLCRNVSSMLQSIAVRWSALSLRTRLYAIIAVLGFLPIAGLIIAEGTINRFTSDVGVLDQVARGTIHLERVNGLVYAVVMESRGIYMSKDWKAAEPFAQNLVAELNDLQIVVQKWKSVVIGSQHRNIEELATHIDNFVRFRTELVRLAREKDTATARAFGDNDANRSARTALNESLNALARAYEQEIAAVRRQIESKEQGFLLIFSLLAEISALVFFSGLILVKHGLLMPLLKMKGLMLRLAQGQLEIGVCGQNRGDEIGEMARALQVFRAALVEHQKLNREIRLLSELNDWLQACKSLDELYKIVAEFLTRLLPDCSGNLYVYANSRDVLECVTYWNGGKHRPPMQPDDCWSLRRGHAIIHDECDIYWRCTHVDPLASSHYCCIPILAHGDTIGLLYLEFSTDRKFGGEIVRENAFSEHRRLGSMCAEAISMAIANVKLRDQLRDQSIHDALTGLFNRRYLLETCQREFSKARARQNVGILSIDIDHFKKCNDNHGHQAGDTILREFGACLHTSFRDGDIACRSGGEEFIVVLPGATPETTARKAEELRSKVESLTVHYLNSTLPAITISIGVAAFPQSGDHPQDVIRAADEALYRAKENGRNRVELSSSITNLARGSSTSQYADLQRILAAWQRPQMVPIKPASRRVMLRSAGAMTPGLAKQSHREKSLKFN